MQICRITGSILVRVAVFPKYKGTRNRFMMPGGRITEIDHIWTLNRSWLARSHDQRAEWSTITIGPFLFAVRMGG
jgi:hypothetical protein